MRLYSVALATLLLTTPAFAGFDELRRDLALVPADPSGSFQAFTYAAPVRGIPVSDSIWTMDTGYGRSMVDSPARAMAKTGVDFGKIESVFETGEPPDIIRIIHGPSGFAGAAAEVLSARQFTTSSVDGFTILSHGEDGAMNMRERGSDDPFAGMLGRSYRLAVGGPHAIVATSDASIAGAIADFNADQCVDCTPWREMLDTVDAAAGWGTLEGATGFSGAALQTPRPTGSGDAVPTPTGLPAYELVLMAMTRDRDAGQLHLAIFFPAGADAAAGAEIIRPVLESQLAEYASGTAPEMDFALTDGTGGTVATFSAKFADGVEAAHAYLHWLNLSFSGQFTPLLLAQ